MTQVRVALVTNMMAPYRIPLFNRIAERFDLLVLVAELRSPQRQWNVPLEEIAFRYSVLNEVERTARGHVRLARALRHRRPDAVIVGGWGFPEAWSALFAARLLRIPIVIWAGLARGSSRSTGILARGARQLCLGTARSFVTYSRTSAALLCDLGADPGAIVIGRNVGDVDYFRVSADASADRAATRFLFVGELLDRKGVRQMLEAFGRRPDRTWRLTIAGRGPLEPMVRSAAETDKRISFVGFQDRAGVRQLMRDADVFVLPSLREVGAIVTSEALASGLFVIASSHDGVAPDLIDPANGVLMDPTRPAAFDDAIRQAVARVTAADWSRTGVAAAFLETDPLAIYADAFERAVALALTSGDAGRPA